MQFVKNGPNVPEPLLQAHEDGRVVFFCGAGISYPANLPGFGGLVEKIYLELGEAFGPLEKSAFDREEFDTTLSLLEARRIDGRTAVRRAIVNVLKPDLSAPNATRTHTALLTLAKSRRDSSRLITTNFDRLFDHALNTLGFELDSYAAPLLPVPKKKWDGIVYLHGHLTDAPSPADLDRLVVSSGDFGLAYLTERWAARFVSELFRHHMVCFVGYSLADPVMRYMMDALAADRLLGEAPVEVYAFGGHKAGEDASAAAQWSAKNVTPILYQDDDGHIALHDTLHAWAETYRDGVRGKEAIVKRYAGLLPVGSTAQDDFVGRMLWALCDESGLPAKAFADYSPLPHLDWLEAFAENRFSHRDLPRFGVPAESALDEKLAYSLTARPASYTKTPWMRLVHRNNLISTRWDKVLPYLARWLVRHLDDPTFLLWVVGEGGHLDDNLRLFVERALDERPISPAMDILWRIVLTGRLANNINRADLYDWISLFKRHGLTPLMRLQLREMLSPRVEMRQPYHWPGADDEGEGQETPSESTERISRLVNWELVLAADYAHSALGDIRKTAEWQAILPSLLSETTGLLLEAMDIMRSLGAANDTQDHSYWHQPSIVEHPQNQKFRDWTLLIEMTRDAWRAAAGATPASALREVDRWFELPYPVFKRLGLFAMEDRPDLFSGRYVVSKLLMDKARWLWSIETQRETMRLIIGRAADLPKAQLHRLQRAIVKGPSREMLRGDGDPKQLRRVKDRQIWLRLTALRDAGEALLPTASARLQSLAAAYPRWEPATERDEFPVWMGTDDNWRQYSIAPKKVKDIVQWLRDHTIVDELHHEDDWRERCRADFRRTAAALLHLAKQGDWPIDRWRSALQAWADKETALRSWRWVSKTLAEAPDHVIAELSHPIAWWLKAVARLLSQEHEPFFSFVRRILAVSVAQDDERESDAMTAAINHPVGMAVEAVLEWWFAGGLEDNQLLDGDVADIFTTVCDLSVSVFRHARILLCGHVITLFRVDHAWASEHLLVQFDWHISTDTARQAWIGYLWSPRIYPPLLDAIKEPFLETACHVPDLDPVSDQYASLLTYISVELDGPFTKSELRSATGELPRNALERAIQTLIDGVQGAADRAAEYWRNRIKPYIANIWPSSHEVRTASISEKFARLAIASGDMFPDALATLHDWLVPIQHPSHILNLLSESQLCERFPSEALTLLDRIVNGGHPWGASDLRKCLVSISTAWPAATGDFRFQRLEVIARQTG